MAKSNVILEYLRHTGAEKEAEMYLKLFKGVEPHRFAIIAIDTQTLAVYERDVAAALAYLSTLGLTPIVMHDATGALGKQLTSDIWNNGGKCQPIMAGLYTGEDAAKSIAAKATGITAVKAIPVIETENAAAMLKQLLPIIKPGKLTVLNRFGGVRTQKGELLSYVNLPNEYDKVLGIAASEYQPLLKTASEALTAANWKLHIEIVPPNGLLTELFTIKGSGTFIKKGPKIAKLSSAETDKAKIRSLLEKSFGKKLKESYFNDSSNVYFAEENYNGVAVARKANGIYYIDKIAVLPEVQGEGLARDLITSIMNSCRKVFWRAKPENHINEWYFRLCSGMQKAGNWFVYWSNLNAEEIKGAIKYAAEKPADFAS